MGSAAVGHREPSSCFGRFATSTEKRFELKSCGTDGGGSHPQLGTPASLKKKLLIHRSTPVVLREVCCWCDHSQWSINTPDGWVVLHGLVCLLLSFGWRKQESGQQEQASE